MQIGKKYNLCIENFRGLLAFAVPKDTMPHNFVEKTFTDSHKTVKFVEVFFPRKFSTIRYLVQKLESVMFERQCQYSSLFGRFKADQCEV